jgi:hypothetical protein
VTGGTRTAVAFALGSFVLYNANVREISSQDTVPNRVLPYEVIEYGRLDLDRLFRDWPAAAPLPFWIQHVGSHYRSSYPVVPALLAVPVYAGPVLLGAGDSWPVLNALAKLAASLFAALSVAFVYLAAQELARRQGSGEATALATAAVYALATPTWAIASQGLWGHGPAQLGLAVSLWAFLRPGTARWGTVLAGLAAGVMVASRPSTALVAAALAGFAVLSRGRAGLLFAGVLGAVVAAVAAHNLAIFGSVQGGYAELHRTHAEHHGVASAWNASFGLGLAGVLVSPSRGLFIYSPVLLFPAVGLLVWLVRRRGGLLACAAVAVAVGIGTIAQFSVWWGGHSFGPRLLADVLPAMVLGVVPVWPAIRRGPVGRWLFAAAFAASVLVQAMGAFYYPSPRDTDWNSSPTDVDFAHERLWDWRDSQLLRLLRNGPVSPGFRTTP